MQVTSVWFWKKLERSKLTKIAKISKHPKKLGFIIPYFLVPSGRPAWSWPASSFGHQHRWCHLSQAGKQAQSHQFLHGGLWGSLYPPLKLTFWPLKIGPKALKRKQSEIPTIHFSGAFAVSFREILMTENIKICKWPLQVELKLLVYTPPKLTFWPLKQGAWETIPSLWGCAYFQRAKCSSYSQWIPTPNIQKKTFPTWCSGSMTSKISRSWRVGEGKTFWKPHQWEGNIPGIF